MEMANYQTNDLAAGWVILVAVLALMPFII